VATVVAGGRGGRRPPRFLSFAELRIFLFVSSAFSSTIFIFFFLATLARSNTSGGGWLTGVFMKFL
jgi:hypothetical protein